MFDYNDKCYLFGMNTFDINGNPLSVGIKFPINKRKFKLPSNIRNMDVVEYHRFNGNETSAKVIFSIYQGTICFYSEVKQNVSLFEEDINDNDLVVYISDDTGKKNIYAKINMYDIVVNDAKEFKKVLFSISDEFSKIEKASNKIRRLSNIGNR